MTADTAAPAERVCAYCGEAAEGNLLPADPSRPGVLLIDVSHDRCNRARLMVGIRRAAAITDARLRPGGPS